MATLRLEGTKELTDKLLQMQTRWKTLSVPFKRAAVVVFGSVKQNFSAGGRPSWKPVARKGEPLRDTGRLMASVTGGAGTLLKEEHFGQTHTLTIGTNVKYANVHQFGFSGSQNVKAHTRTQRMAFGRKMTPRSVAVKSHSRNINIAARPFIMLQNSDKTDIANIFQDWLFKG